MVSRQVEIGHVVLHHDGVVFVLLSHSLGLLFNGASARNMVSVSAFAYPSSLSIPPLLLLWRAVCSALVGHTKHRSMVREAPEAIGGNVVSGGLGFVNLPIGHLSSSKLSILRGAYPKRVRSFMSKIDLSG